MRRVPILHRLGACLLVLLAAAAPQPIGSWVLQCSGRGRCLLQHRAWILPPGPGHPGAALQVQRRGDWLVPVVTLHDVATQVAVGGLLTLHPVVVLQFEPGGPARLSCGFDAGAVVCTPDQPAASAAALARATAVQAVLHLTLPGGATLPVQGTALALSGTTEALDRLRAAGAEGESLPAEPGLDWIGFLNKVMQAAGFSDGLAGLVPRLAGR